MPIYTDEDETVIVINEADKREGFFRWSTTKASDFTKLIRRVGGAEKLLDVKTHTHGKRVTSWVCQVPIEFLSRSSWGIGKKRKGRENPFNNKLEKVAA